jgi:hypothetical protein
MLDWTDWEVRRTDLTNPKIDLRLTSCHEFLVESVGVGGSIDFAVY